MKKSGLIAALQDVPDDADVLVAMGAGEGIDHMYSRDFDYRTFPRASEAWYKAGLKRSDVRPLSVSYYDTGLNAVWLEL